VAFVQSDFDRAAESPAEFVSHIGVNLAAHELGRSVLTFELLKIVKVFVVVLTQYFLRTSQMRGPH